MPISGSLTSMLHMVGQVLLYPTVAVLLLLVAYSLYQVGSVLVEYFSERRRLNQSIPELIKQIHESKDVGMAQLINDSGLLRRQKKALLELFSYRDLPLSSLDAVARKLLEQEEDHYNKRVQRTVAISRVAPMFGLMGTLIPLGPGIIALSTGDVYTLANSLMVAFDTTIAGLAASAICFLISTARRRWYNTYMVSLDSLMTSVIDKIEEDSYE